MNLNQTQLAALANLPAIRQALAVADAEALQMRQALVAELDAAREQARRESAPLLAAADRAFVKLAELRAEIKVQQALEADARTAAHRCQRQLDRTEERAHRELQKTTDPLLAEFHGWAINASCDLANFGWRETVVATAGEAFKPVMQRERERSREAKRLADIATSAQEWARAQLYEATPKADLTAYMTQVSNTLVSGAHAIGLHLRGFEQ